MLESATRLVNTFVSHNGRSTLDYVMIPKYMEGNVLSSCTGRNVGENTSDHFPIEVILDDRMIPRTVNTAKRAPRLKWKKVGGEEMSDLYERPVREGIQDRCHSLLDGEGG